MRDLLTMIGLILYSSGPLLADDFANQLTLADLAAYREALAGKATADDARAADPPVPASFRDIWDKADTLKGRRVEVRGRIERIFRQGPVGRFPALVQAWAFSPSGDPFCLVYPANSNQGPGLGAEARFTGTFLKVVEYPAGDGPRLAPMIVGDRVPLVVKKSPAIARPTDKSKGVQAGSRASIDWIIGLLVAAAVVGVLAVRHLGFGRPSKRVRSTAEIDPPLEFVSSEGRTGETS
jgi:hypothetical protein